MPEQETLAIDMDPSEPPNTVLSALRRSVLLLQIYKLTLVTLHNGFQALSFMESSPKNNYVWQCFLRQRRSFLPWSAVIL